LSGENAPLIAHLAAGRPGRAFALASDATSLSERDGAVDDLVRLDAGDQIARLKGAERLAQAHGKTPEATERWLEMSLLWWRDVLLVRAGCDELVVNKDRSAELRRRAQRLTIEQAAQALRAIEQTSQYLTENVQPRIALELLLLSLPPAA
jgi:DNA polymerase-3 subunit delta'